MTVHRELSAFVAAMSAADAALSRRVMLPALSPFERARILTALRVAAPASVAAAVLDEARELLADADWHRLATALELE